MADLLRAKQYQEIMTKTKKKINIFKNKLQKTKQNINSPLFIRTPKDANWFNLHQNFISLQISSETYLIKKATKIP